MRRLSRGLQDPPRHRRLVPASARIKELPYVFGLRQHGESKLDSLVALDFVTLLLDKLVGRWVPVRFVMFTAVGSLGILLHMAVLTAALRLGVSFLPAQTLATAVAIAGNFFLNNALTYRDKRLKGLGRVLLGLVSFYAVCSVGAWPTSASPTSCSSRATLVDLRHLRHLVGAGGTTPLRAVHVATVMCGIAVRPAVSASRPMLPRIGERGCYCRVGPGNFTPSPSQIRTGYSRIIRLVLSREGRRLPLNEGLLPVTQLAQIGGDDLPLSRSPNPKGPPSSPVQLRVAVWTGDTRDTRPGTDLPRTCELEGEFDLQPRAQRAVLGGGGRAEQIAHLVLDFAGPKNVTEAVAARQHRAQPKLLLIEVAGFVEVLDLAVESRSPAENSD